MGIANFPLPSFTLVLTSDRVVIPGPSYVIRLAPVGSPHLPQNIAVQTIHTNINPKEEKYFHADLNLGNDSATDVALGHSDSETPMMQPVKKDAGNKRALPISKTRPTTPFRFKNIFKRFSMYPDKEAV